MWAILAFAAFAVALILHLAGSATTYVIDATLIGFALLALHWVWGYTPWRRQP